jgi:hypothetical protein
MSRLESTFEDEPFVSALVACDEALASGGAGDDHVCAELAPELRACLEGDLACIELLRQILPRRASTPSVDQPFTELGRYQVGRELGRGSFGIVFLAYDPDLRRLVALKIPKPEALPSDELRHGSFVKREPRLASVTLTSFQSMKFMRRGRSATSPPSTAPASPWRRG